MTKGIYEGCVGDYMKVTIWCGGFFRCRKLTFFAAGQDSPSPHLQGFPQMLGLGEREGQSRHDVQ